LAEFSRGSDFLNFGYWREDTRDPREASENLMEILLEFLPEKTGPILDVACGLGATTRYLLKYYRPSDVIAINILEQQLVKSRTNAPGCTFILMDAARLPTPRSTV
jgi:cyclopropane fatty-acyl-phospholipid synthase-like methyltransferase